MKAFITAMIGAVSLLSPSAYARLGETLEQSESRYGKPVDTVAFSREGIDKYRYRKNEISITAEFFHNKCIQIQFSVSDRLMTTDLVKTLLEANGSGWKMLSSLKDANGVVTDSTYSCSGATASARKGHLVITVVNYEDLLLQAAKEHEQKVKQ